MQAIKRTLCFCMAVFLLLCGCERNKEEKSKPPLQFSAQIEVTHGKLQYTADCTLHHAQSCDLMFSAPKALCGLEILQTPMECTVKLLGLEVKAPITYLPQTAFAKLLFTACASLSDPENYITQRSENKLYYIGKTPNGEAFTFVADAETENLEALEMKEEGLTIHFSAFQRL